MAIHEITMWRTEDGHSFESLDEAREWEDTKKLSHALVDECDQGWDDAIEIARWLKRNFLIVKKNESRPINPNEIYLVFGRGCECDNIVDEKVMSITDILQEGLPDCHFCNQAYQVVTEYELV